MFSTTKSSAARRTLARVAVAGALTAIPLTALAIPASADPALPGATEVHHHWRDCDDFGPFRDWNCDDGLGPFDNDWHWRHHDDPFWQFFHGRPSTGSFGSS
ncbi:MULTISPECIES: hypothetical protein [unclassified Nocardia]|uniref:hypothetical protein n=1 Tax=unclassified Nocardia TaxID=2637762 RepID=UPI001CE40B33|nr:MULTISPECIES: hypothetical protein [unclassified Nocardia]